MVKKVLQFLKSYNGFVSGEDISKSLSISRSAVWKHIANLRNTGYVIEAVPHLGYRLLSTPDKLLPEEISYHLKTKIIGKKIFYYKTVDSTMDIAFDLGIKGYPEGTVVFAEQQIKGRGRLGREWFSPKAKGIYLSLLLRPQFLPQESPKLTLMAAVSINQAIKKITGVSPLIKWPNDIIINSKKVAGILTELDAETDRIKFVNIGIGLNVNSPKTLLFKGSTSLRVETNKEVSRVKLAREILRSIEENYFALKKDGFALIRKKWKAQSLVLGKRIKVYYGNRFIEGEAKDIDSDGALLIRQDNGFVDKVLSGDVISLEK